MVAITRRTVCGGVALLGGCASLPNTPSDSAFASEVEHLHFQSGIQAVLCKTPSTSAPARVFVGLYLNYGVASERRPELAHLVEHVAVNNTPTLQDFSIPADFRPIDSNAMTRLDYTSMWRVVPPEMLDPFVGNRANRAVGMNNDPAVFERERERVATEIERAANSVQADFGADPDRLLAAAFRGPSPSVAERAALTRVATADEAFAAINAYYRPSNATLVVAGDFDMAAARASVERRLGAYPTLQAARSQVAAPFAPYSGPMSARSTVLTKPFIAAGLPGPDRRTRDFTAFLVLDQLLLGGRRAFSAPSEIERAQDAPLARRLAASLGGESFDDATRYSQCPPLLAFRSPTYLTVRFAAQTGVTAEQAQGALEAALSDIAATVTDDEIISAREQLSAFLSSWMLSPNLLAMADHLAAFAFIDRDARRLNRLDQEIRAVRPEEVRALLRRTPHDLRPRLAFVDAAA